MIKNGYYKTTKNDYLGAVCKSKMKRILQIFGIVSMMNFVHAQIGVVKQIDYWQARLGGGWNGAACARDWGTNLPTDHVWLPVGGGCANLLFTTAYDQAFVGTFDLEFTGTLFSDSEQIRVKFETGDYPNNVATQEFVISNANRVGEAVKTVVGDDGTPIDYYNYRISIDISSDSNPGPHYKLIVLGNDVAAKIEQGLFRVYNSNAGNNNCLTFTGKHFGLAPHTYFDVDENGNINWNYENIYLGYAYGLQNPNFMVSNSGDPYILYKFFNNPDPEQDWNGGRTLSDCTQRLVFPDADTKYLIEFKAAIHVSDATVDSYPETMDLKFILRESGAYNGVAHAGQVQKEIPFTVSTSGDPQFSFLVDRLDSNGYDHNVVQIREILLVRSGENEASDVEIAFIDGIKITPTDGTCGTYDCPASHTPKGSLGECTDGKCSVDQCCDALATCLDHACPINHVPKIPSPICGDGGCDDATCCDLTCESHTCDINNNWMDKSSNPVLKFCVYTGEL